MPSNNKYKQKVILQKIDALRNVDIDYTHEQQVLNKWAEEMEISIFKHCKTVNYFEEQLAQAKEKLKQKKDYYMLMIKNAETALNAKKIPATNLKIQLLELELEKVREEAVKEREKKIADGISEDLRPYEKEYMLLGGELELHKSYDEWRLEAHPESKKPSVAEKIAVQRASNKVNEHQEKINYYKKTYAQWTRNEIEDLPGDWDNEFYDKHCS
jgi:hypothetical protein